MSINAAQICPFGKLTLGVLRLGVGHGDRSRWVSRGPSSAAIPTMRMLLRIQLPHVS